MFTLRLLLSISSLLFTSGYLYNEETGLRMHILNGTTIDSVLMDSTSGNIWLVQFFSHWCGSCQNFVPKWLNIVRNSQHWSPIVKTGAMDCAVDVSVCRKYRVTGYPTVRIYWPSVLGKVYHDFGLLLAFPAEDFKNRIAKTVVSIATDSSNFGIMPDIVKYLHPSTLEENGLVHFFDDMDPSIPQNYLILEDESDAQRYGAFSPFVCLNTSSLHAAGLINVKYVSLNEMEVYDLQNILRRTLKMYIGSLELPALIELDITNFRGTKVIATGKREIEIFFETFAEIQDRLIEVMTTPSPLHNLITTTMSLRAKWLPEDDLYGAVYHFIHQEVGVHDYLTQQQLSDLRDFLSAIVSYVPFITPQIREPLRELYVAVSGLNGPQQLQIAAWFDIVDRVRLPRQRPWNHCKGSRPQFRGYPCSLWLLFHTITSNAAKQPDSFELTTVFPAIRGFVRSFFGCRGCAAHFWNATEKYAYTPNSEAHVLMWKIHNIVNSRLAGAVSEDPLSPKIQFPPEHICPECRRDSAEDSWNRKIIDIFLRRYYSARSVIPLSDFDSTSEFQITKTSEYLYKTD